MLHNCLANRMLPKNESWKNKKYSINNRSLVCLKWGKKNKILSFFIFQLHIQVFVGIVNFEHSQILAVNYGRVEKYHAVVQLDVRHIAIAVRRRILHSYGELSK